MTRFTQNWRNFTIVIIIDVNTIKYVQHIYIQYNSIHVLLYGKYRYKKYINSICVCICACVHTRLKYEMVSTTLLNNSR